MNSRKLMLLLAISAMAICVGLAVLGREPLYGQGGSTRIPAMLGQWSGQGAGYGFENVLDPSSQPQYSENEGQGLLNITAQNDRAFAGTFGAGDKLTGVILPAGTVSMQTYRDNNRMFLTGTLTDHGRGGYVITGYIDSFEDLTRAVMPGMGTAYFQAIKAN